MVEFIRERIGPPRFVAFLVILAAATAIGWAPLGWKHAFMTAFDIAATFFLIACAPMLRKQDAKAMKQQARDNDANRVLLLVLSAVISGVVIVAVGVELAGDSPHFPLAFSTLLLSWILSQTIYALHYAYIYYIEDKVGGIAFPETPEPDYADFVYFAFTTGMAFQPSDAETTNRHVRLVATVHAFMSYLFSVGVIAFAISSLSG